MALVQRAAEGWQCLALAPSDVSFLAIAAGEPWDTSRKAQGSESDPAALLEACQQLAGQPVDCVAMTTCNWLQLTRCMNRSSFR